MSNKKVTLKIEVATASFTLNNVIVVDDLALPLHILPDENLIIVLKQTEIKISPYKTIPDILIGQDNCHLIISREI